MKKLQLFVLATLLCNICVFGQSMIDKAKLLVRNEFKENMNDYSSYSPVKYGSIDSLFTQLEEDEGFCKAYHDFLEAKAKVLDGDSISINTDIKFYLNYFDEKIKNESFLEKRGLSSSKNLSMLMQMRYDYAALDVKQRVLQLTIESFSPEFIGWKMIHKYRAKNEFGGIVLYSKEFHFDKEFKKITLIKDCEQCKSLQNH